MKKKMYEKPKFEVFEIRLSESIASDIDSCRPQLGITVQQGGRNNIKVDWRCRHRGKWCVLDR